MRHMCLTRSSLRRIARTEPTPYGAAERGARAEPSRAEPPIVVGEKDFHFSVLLAQIAEASHDVKRQVCTSRVAAPLKLTVCTCAEAHTTPMGITVRCTRGVGVNVCDDDSD